MASNDPPAAIPPEWSTRFRVTIEPTHRVEGVVDAVALIAYFPDEWAEFMRGDEPSEDDVYEFVKETAHDLGSDIFAPGICPYASEVKSDDDIDIEVREIGRAVVQPQ